MDEIINGHIQWSTIHRSQDLVEITPTWYSTRHIRDLFGIELAKDEESKILTLRLILMSCLHPIHHGDISFNNLNTTPP